MGEQKGAAFPPPGDHDPGAIQGKGVAVLSKELADMMGQSFRVAERLIRTEANHFHNAADVAAYEAAGVRQYGFIATLDNRTSAVCAGLDGKVFDIKDARTRSELSAITSLV